MGARQKLNSWNLKAALIVAAFIGGAAGSWVVFFIAAGVLIAGGLIAGDIRMTPRR